MKLSKSRIACCTQCPMKVRLRYIDEIRVPATPAMTEGSAQHAVVESGLKSGDRMKGCALQTVIQAGGQRDAIGLL